MKTHKRATVIGVLAGVVGTILFAVAAWLLVVYTGAYDVAASDPHTDAVRWTLDTTMRRSVVRRAGAVELPDPLPEALLREGATHYASSCAHCHGAPGSDAATWAEGMRPEPPHLPEVASEWSASEIHWLIDNGIKMSGMPAFGGHHGEDELLALTAFVTALPGLTPKDYAAMTEGAAGGGGHHHDSGTPHGDTAQSDTPPSDTAHGDTAHGDTGSAHGHGDDAARGT